jgi:hypothetical protein
VGCSVDSATGNLAVTFFGSSSPSVAIFAHAKGSPTVYKTPINVAYCGYDNAGNLFVDGRTSSNTFALVELPKGSTEFTNISINGDITYFAGQVQWDGQYISVQTLVPTRHIESGPIIYQLDVSGSSATIVKAIHFRKATGGAAQSWIDAQTVIMPYGDHKAGFGTPNVGVWQYPKGGEPIKSFKGVGSEHEELTGVALSEGTH